jgi:lipopolysaccharide O-acetyltransferase
MRPNRWQRWWAWQRYRRRFAWYARSAYLAKPELLVRPEGIHLDWGARIRAHARLECLEHDGTLGHIEIGEGATIEYYFHAAAAEQVTLGQRVLIASRVYISDHDHAMPWKEGRLVVKPVVIGDGCWIGEGACILKGVELGANCVVGANAVVTKSFPPGSILGGVPAQQLVKEPYGVSADV